MKTPIKIPIPSFFIALILALACGVGLLPKAEAVSPPPDGAYPNFTTAEGQHALQDLTSGAGNTALGAYSLFSTTTASFNTAIGAGALDLNTGDSNTAVGVAALLLNTGTQNTAVGVDALGLNTAGGFNAAVGAFALYNNSTGIDNTAVGDQALFSNSTANGNTAIGTFALFSNTIGADNTAIGDVALIDNTTGSSNTGIGVGTLANNTTSSGNTAIGFNALISNVGSDNTAIGSNAGSNLTTGTNNICVGAGVAGVAGDDHTIRIGDTTHGGAAYIAGIWSMVASGGAPVFINSDGKLATNTSSKRFKQDIAPMDKASEAVLSLKPVTFHYKKELDPKGIPQFGLVAEDVEKVNPDLVVRDKESKPYTVRYDAVNAMLLNEFLKEHRTVEELKKEIATLTATVKEQASLIQKVSAQLELGKPAPQTVLNDQ